MKTKLWGKLDIVVEGNLWRINSTSASAEMLKWIGKDPHLTHFICILPKWNLIGQSLFFTSMCFLLKTVLELELKQWKNKLLIIFKLERKLINLITHWSLRYNQSHWWAVFFKAVKFCALLWYISTELTCLVSIAPAHCRQQCFALPHSHFLFSVYHLCNFCLSETLWVFRKTFSFASRRATVPQYFCFAFPAFLHIPFHPLNWWIVYILSFCITFVISSLLGFVPFIVHFQHYQIF